MKRSLLVLVLAITSVVGNAACVAYGMQADVPLLTSVAVAGSMVERALGPHTEQALRPVRVELLERAEIAPLLHEHGLAKAGSTDRATSVRVTIETVYPSHIIVRDKPAHLRLSEIAFFSDSEDDPGPASGIAMTRGLLNP
jgi:hypothetical protein